MVGTVWEVSTEIERRGSCGDLSDKRRRIEEEEEDCKERREQLVMRNVRNENR